MPSRADNTWDGSDWPGYSKAMGIRSETSTPDHDPHARPLARAISKGWSEELRMNGWWNAQGIQEAWTHTTPDGVVHIGWACTYCGIEIAWEHSTMGKPEIATCSTCVTEYAASKLDPEGWARKGERLVRPRGALHPDEELHDFLDGADADKEG